MSLIIYPIWKKRSWKLQS